MKKMSKQLETAVDAANKALQPIVDDWFNLIFEPTKGCENHSNRQRFASKGRDKYGNYR